MTVFSPLLFTPSYLSMPISHLHSWLHNFYLARYLLSRYMSLQWLWTDQEKPNNKRRTYHAGNNFDLYRYIDASGSVAHLAAQSSVGLLPEWWAWRRIFGTDHFVSIGQNLKGWLRRIKQIQNLQQMVHRQLQSKGWVTNENNTISKAGISASGNLYNFRLSLGAAG